MALYQKAFVLIKVSPRHVEDVVDELMRVPEVTEAHIVPGDWDIIAVIKSERDLVAPSDEKVYRVILNKIEKIRHVQDTNTMVSQFSRTK